MDRITPFAVFYFALSAVLLGAGSQAQSVPPLLAAPTHGPGTSWAGDSDPVSLELVDALASLADESPSAASDALGAILDESHAAGNDLAEAIAAWGLAATRIEQAQYREARDLAARSRRVAQRAGSSDWTSHASSLESEASKLLETHSTDTAVARSLFLERLGLLEMGLYRFGDALQRFDDALTLIEGRGMTIREAGLRADRGMALSALRQPEAATADLDAFRKAAERENPQLGSVADLMSDLLLGMSAGDFESALAKLETLGERYHDRLPPVFFDNLKLVSLLREGKTAEASDLCHKILASNQQKASEMSDATARMLMGMRLNCTVTDFLLAADDGPPSTDDYMKLANMVRGLIDSQPATVQEPMSSLLGQFVQMAQHPEQPAEWPSGPELQRSLDALENLVATAAPPGLRSGLDDALSPFAHLFAMVDEKIGNVEGAFEHAEQARARELLDGLADARIADQSDGAEATEIAALRRRRDGLERRVEHAFWNMDQGTDLDANREELTTVRREIDAVFHRLSLRETSTERAKPLPLAAIQSQLDSSTALVAFLTSSSAADETLAWIVHCDDIELVSLETNADDLENRIVQFREDIRRREPVEKEAETLYRLLWSPIRNRVRTERVLLVPHGPLQELPFAALLDPNTHRWLIQDVSLLYAPSASIYARLRGRPVEKGSGPLILGDPTGGLPAATAEAKSVARTWKTRPLLGPAASEEALRELAPAASLIHIASHGVIDHDNPLFTHLVLAPSPDRPKDPNADGRLEIHEIASQLRLARTELVVLPACNSGEGPRTRGEEITSLARAFLLAGAHSTVTTSWEVDDQASANLMVDFERRLAEGDRESDALRDAQIHVMERTEWSHPWYWAGFALHGAGGRVAYPAVTGNEVTGAVGERDSAD